MKKRVEKDYLGKKEVPSSAYYGIQTERAVENFDISSLTIQKEFIISMAHIKKAAALANMFGSLDKKRGTAIVCASNEIIRGKFDDQFVVDVYQAGAGTSQHMNMNEVIANRALQLLGKRRGNYGYLHPNDHVNMGQSTNDVYPTAMRVTVLRLLPGLVQAMHSLEKNLKRKSSEFRKIKKSGRTHLQDAVPVTLGNEFGSYATIISELRSNVLETVSELREIGIGGTAVGTGVNTNKSYHKKVVSFLGKSMGLSIVSAKNLFAAMNSMKPFTRVSGILRNISIELIRIGNDLRLLQSGPGTGLHEINLPEVQPGSSIMPGKVNPSIVECLQMVCFQVIGNDHTITEASEAGQLELNVFMPVINYNLLQSLKILTNGISMFDGKCIQGIKANKEVCKGYIERSVGLASLLNPVIGFDAAAAIAKESVKTGKSIKEIVLRKNILSKREFDRLIKKSL